MARRGSGFHPGNEDHPVDEALIARSLDYRAFNPPRPVSDDGYVIQYGITGNTLTLPTGQTFTPSGMGVTPGDADLRFVAFQFDQTGTINDAGRAQARTNLALGNASTFSFATGVNSGTANTIARGDHEHTASQITDFADAVLATPAITDRRTDAENDARYRQLTVEIATSEITDFNTEVDGLVTVNTDVAANTAARHDAVTLAAGSQGYITLADQVLTIGAVDLSGDNVTGRLSVSDHLVMNELQTVINNQITANRRAHTFADMAAFNANTFTWNIGDIATIGASVYLYTGTGGQTSTDLADFTLFTSGGVGITQAAADGRYVSFALNQTTTDAQKTQARTNIGTGSIATHDLLTGAIPATPGPTANFIPNVGQVQSYVRGNFEPTISAANQVDYDTEIANLPDLLQLGTTATTALAGNTDLDNVDINQYDTVDATGIATGDFLIFQDVSDSNDNKKITTANFRTSLAIPALAGSGASTTQAARVDHLHDGVYPRMDNNTSALSETQRNNLIANLGGVLRAFGTENMRRVGDFTAVPYNVYVLGNLTEGTTSTATLPAGNEGDEITFVNLSTLNAPTPSMPVASGTWVIARNGSELIHGVDENLTLDVGSVSFSLIYTGAMSGWVIKAIA